LRTFYSKSADTLYERPLGSSTLHVPIGFVSEIDLMSDARYQKKDLAMHLVAKLPEVEARSPSNLRGFFPPFDIALLTINVGPRTREADEWSAVIQSTYDSALRSSNSPVRKVSRFGLEAWGEDLRRWPKRRPCASLSEDLSTCTSPAPPDVFRPLSGKVPASVMTCDSDALPDVDAVVAAMPYAEREAYFSSKRWAGVRRATCRHTMFYAPLNAHVTLNYPRRFLQNWADIEARVTSLLDSSLGTKTTDLSKVWRP